MDAWKFLSKYKRPIPFKASDIGIWSDIISAISYFAVLTNVSIRIEENYYKEIHSGNCHRLDIRIYS